MLVGDTFIVEDVSEAFMVSQDVLAYDSGEIDHVDFAFMWGVYPDDFEWIKVNS
jgi:hypothetical protein